MDTIPALIDKYRADNEKLARDVPTLKAVVEEVWKKEDELKGLKTELVAMERKIETSLNHISNSVGISGEIPKDGAKSESLQVPEKGRYAESLQASERPQVVRDSFEERIVAARTSHGLPEKRGSKSNVANTSNSKSPSLHSESDSFLSTLYVSTYESVFKYTILRG